MLSRRQQSVQGFLDDGKIVEARSVVCAKTNASEPAEVAEDFPADEVVEKEWGWHFSSDGEAKDADDGDKDDQRGQKSEETADDIQRCGGSEDTLRRRDGARRAPVECWRPGNLIAQEAFMKYVQAVQGKASANWQISMKEEMEAIRKNKTWRLTNGLVSRHVLKGKWV